MSDSIIKVENLGKKYRLGVARHDTLRDRLMHAVRAPFQRGGKGTGADPEDFWALQDVSFEVKQGEVLGIIGRNGAGKSTLLKILSRITEPTEGRVAIRGRVASLLEVGTGFHPELSGRENVFLNGAVLGMTRAEIRRKFDEIVAFAEVERFLDTPVKHYSSGMYVRLAFAVAAHLEPEILIVDEVLAVGDFAFQQKCLGKMNAVAGGEGRTVLFVSHNIGTVANLCANTMWLATGRVTVCGATPKVISEYIRSQTARTATSFEFGKFDSVNRRKSRLVITGLELNRDHPVVHRESFHARISFAVNCDVRDVAFGIGICTPEGTRIATIDSDIDGATKNYPAQYKGVIELSLNDFPLSPGRYSIDVGARSGAVTSLDYLPGCGMFDVHPGPRTQAGAVQISNGGLRLVSISTESELPRTERSVPPTA